MTPKESIVNTVIHTESQARDNINLAGDLFQTVGLAAAVGVATAVVSALVVLMITLVGG